MSDYDESIQRGCSVRFADEDRPSARERRRGELVPRSAKTRQTSEFDGFARVARVSSRYDPSIVYVVDECLTRGVFGVFVKWFESYAANTDLPGCIVVAGYRSDTRIRSSLIDQEDSIHYVRLDPRDKYPIFELKRATNCPSVTILLTARGSRLENVLTCDGCIALNPRDSMERNCDRVATILASMTERYLSHFHDSRESHSDDADDIDTNDDDDADEFYTNNDSDNRKNDSEKIDARGAKRHDFVDATIATDTDNDDEEEENEEDEDDDYRSESGDQFERMRKNDASETSRIAMERDRRILSQLNEHARQLREIYRPEYVSSTIET